MARTIRTKVFKFDELSEKAKQVAIDNYRNKGIDSSYIYDEAHETVKAFNDVFGTRSGRHSWLTCNCEYIDDNVLELVGLRLRTYIINHFWNDIFKGKYFSLQSKTEVSYKYYEKGFPVRKSRYSKVLFEDYACPLTGVCYDNSILDPIYKFLKWNDNPTYYATLDFKTLMDDCYSSIEQDLKNEENAMYEDDYIKEQLEGDLTEYTKDGEVFNY